MIKGTPELIGERREEIVGNGAKVLSGKRFAAGVTENELKRWTEEIGG